MILQEILWKKDKKGREGKDPVQCEKDWKEKLKFPYDALSDEINYYNDLHVYSVLSNKAELEY